jgi:phosphohistidine phosphatase
MALFLVQHGKSLSADVDPEQGLSEEGRSEAGRIADVAKGYRVHVSRIQHSGKKRARETAEILASALHPGQGVQERPGLKPLDDVAGIAGNLDGAEDLMLVGHLPFMSRLASYLITKNTDLPVFRFQNGGILCLDQEPNTRSWIIKWALMPNID